MARLACVLARRRTEPGRTGTPHTTAAFQSTADAETLTVPAAAAIPGSTIRPSQPITITIHRNGTHLTPAQVRTAASHLAQATAGHLATRRTTAAPSHQR